MTKKIIIAAGIWAVGKSYFADKFIKEHPEYRLVHASMDRERFFNDIAQHEYVITDYYFNGDYNAEKLKKAMKCAVEIIVLFERPEVTTYRQIFGKDPSPFHNVSMWVSQECYQGGLKELFNTRDCKFMDGKGMVYSRSKFMAKYNDFWWPPDKEEIEEYLEGIAQKEGYDWEYHEMILPYNIKIGKEGYARNVGTWEMIQTLDIDWRWKKVLDCGCFHGYYCQKIAKEGGIVTGCDRHQDALYSAAIFSKWNNIKFNLHLCELDSDLPGDNYDVGLVLSVFHHITKQDEFMTRISERCKQVIWEINNEDRDKVLSRFKLIKEVKTPKDNRTILLTEPKVVG
ncbi:MAG: methyltransferase domain-containing protein [bacterium]|nr:methyltransferase domain-containing protein [bacterium]